MNKKIIRQNFNNEIRQTKSDYFEFKNNNENTKFSILEKRYESGLSIKKHRNHFQEEVITKVKYTKYLYLISFLISKFFYEIWFKLSNYKFIRKIKKENEQTNQFAGKHTRAQLVNKILQIIFLSISAIVIVFPFYWMLNISLTPDEYLLSGDVPPILPLHWSIQPYKDLIHFINQREVYEVSFARIMWNSVLITLVSVMVQIIISVTAGFAMANFKNNFIKIVSVIFIAALAIPGESLILGQLVFMKQLGMGNTFMALIVPFAANIVGIYLIANAFRSIPSQLKKATQVDGLSTGKYFFKVAIPHIKYSIMLVMVLSLISSWNSLLWPTAILNSDSQWVTLPMLLWGLINPENLPNAALEDPINLKMAGTIISTIPMLLLCLVFNKLFIKGNKNINM
ncbi:carbohydrate ABC transporter permease [Spiroplasma endosymbiont of Othius punctulatus]|uniref:carbohydrate ABC transporter permease n=1 Tax=Spiroplasma endosymbiont of Othius punctulatus TaxID=3066289 RepID=UPI0030CE600B